MRQGNVGLAIFSLTQICSLAQTTLHRPQSSRRQCLRSIFRRRRGRESPALFSSHGVLNVDFSYQTRTDAYGRALYCFMTPSGLENPTLHVSPGDA